MTFSSFAFNQEIKKGLQGRIQDLKIEGAQKICSAHHEREARGIPLIRPGSIEPKVKGSGSSKVVWVEIFTNDSPYRNK